MVIDHNYSHLKLSTVNSKTTVTHIKFAKKTKTNPEEFRA